MYTYMKWIKAEIRRLTKAQLTGSGKQSRKLSAQQKPRTMAPVEKGTSKPRKIRVVESENIPNPIKVSSQRVSLLGVLANATNLPKNVGFNCGEELLVTSSNTSFRKF
jgi:hypothetical protein